MPLAAEARPIVQVGFGLEGEPVPAPLPRFIGDGLELVSPEWARRRRPRRWGSWRGYAQNQNGEAVRGAGLVERAWDGSTSESPGIAISSW